MKYLITHKEYGVYLGMALGLGFWSRLDPVGQTSAPLFPSSEAAHAHLESWDTPLPKEEITLLPLDTPRDYATIDECDSAGAPRWLPDDVAGAG